MADSRDRDDFDREDDLDDLDGRAEGDDLDDYDYDSADADDDLADDDADADTGFDFDPDSLSDEEVSEEDLEDLGDSRTGILSEEGGSRLTLEDIHGGTLKPVGLSSEMRLSFIEYSMSVIVARALPDVRDGLKPVHRRILYAMSDAGITPNRPHKKSAWTVGEVIGKYHPHGDASVYDAMVRLAQDFSMRVPLVDGHGNFGSIDGDPPAAMRYTEARLARPAMEMLRDLKDDTVDWQPNYDESVTEPSVLPARFPNLLVNGSSGIAVGMATNVPPHNLGEVIDAVCLRIDNPECTLDELMDVIPGPDFPTGGTIMGTQGIRDAYETGRGSITVRAKAHIENVKKGQRQRIVVTEIPYQVNKGLLQEKIGQLINERKIDGISDMRDESNRKGMRLVFDLKREAIPQVVLNNLYKQSQLQTTFGAIDLALVNGVPKTLTLAELIDHYIAHQVDVVTRRTRFRLEKAQRELHIREGLLIAVDNIDEVVAIIRSSYDDAEVKERFLAQFGLDDIQSTAILEMRLRRLTGLERENLVAEIERLTKEIAYLQGLLDDKSKLMALIKDELNEIKQRYNTPRRTTISTEPTEISVEDLIAEEDMVVTITHASYIKRLPVATYRSQRRGGKGLKGLSLKDHDFVEELFVASTHDYVLFFTNFGKVYRLKVHELPIGSRQSRGKALVNLLALEEGEHPMAVLPTREFPEDTYLMFATRQGLVKKTSMAAYDRNRTGGMIAIKLRAGDELVSVRRVRSGEKVILASSDGHAILFNESDVRPMGRDTSGVHGIALKPHATMLGMEITNGKGDLFVITEKGYGKRTPISDYPERNRGAQGVYTIKMTPQKGDLVAIKVIGPQHELMIVSEEGTVIRVKTSDISQLSRVTQGVKVMNVAEGDRVKAVARMVARKPQAATAAHADDAQGVLALDVEDPSVSVDVGGEEAFDDTLLDE